MRINRRLFVGIAAATPLAIWTVRAAADQPAACYDPASLPLSQKSRRRSLGYVDQSADPLRRCGECSFFTGSSAACGTCAMLGGGSVSLTGLCSSFSARSGKQAGTG